MVGVEVVSVLVGKLELVFMHVYKHYPFFFCMNGGMMVQQTFGLVCHVRT